MLASASLRSHRIWLTVFTARLHQQPVAFDAGRTICPLPSETAPWKSRRRRYASSTRSENSREVPASIPQPAYKRLNFKQPGSRKIELGRDEHSAAISELRAALAEPNLQKIIKLYDSCPDKKLLTAADFRSLAQCLHTHSTQFKRLTAAHRKRADGEQLIAFAHQLIKDLKKDLLPPNPRASTSLLYAFNQLDDWDAGVQFWDWLQTQDETYLQLATYGAAIELLAVRGLPLPELEELYQQALVRFPGNFTAYHLSPYAILPDRERPFDVKGMPIALLQGILVARLMGGDSRNAYLALDTVLRLFPTEARARFFTTFLGERPVSECYSVFALAYRAGIQLPVHVFKAMLSALRASSDVTDVSRHFLALRSMFSITYMHVGAWSTLTTNTVNELLIAMTQTLRLQGVEKLEQEQQRQIASALLEVVRQILEVFSRYGAKPGIAAFNSIITNIAGFGQQEGTIATALADMKSLGLKPNDVTRRSVLTAAGTLRDGNLVWKAWTAIVSAKNEDGKLPDATDFHILVKACVQANESGAVRKELETFGKHLHEQEMESLLSRLEKGERETDGETSPVDVQTILEEIKKVKADVEIIDRNLGERPMIQDFSEQALPMTIVPVAKNMSLREADMQIIYDELTTEQKPKSGSNHAHEASATDAFDRSAAMTSPAEEPDPVLPSPESHIQLLPEARSSTNTSFANLRYESWKVINHLLAQADRHDKIYLKTVDEAIARGVAPQKRDHGIALDPSSEVRSYGLSDAFNRIGEVEGRADAGDVEKVREEILRVRGLVQSEN